MIAAGKIQVLIVEDSQVVLMRIAHLLNSDPRMEVIGSTRNGREALRFLSKKRPDVILMGIEMPDMDGLEVIRRIMETQPIPIIACSDPIARRDPATTVKLLEAGAVACIETPRGNHPKDSDESAALLLQTVKLMSEVKVVHRWSRTRRKAEGTTVGTTAFPTESRAGASVVGIGASTGGPEALKTILEGLPSDFPVPLLVVQHIARGFVGGLAQWLGQSTGVEVHIAAHGEVPLPGHAYLAPDDCHMELGADGTIVLVEDEPEKGVRPSVSHLFESLARTCGPSAIGVLLTGMGKDGAQALKRMRARGAVTIAQDRKSSVIHGMPGEAIAIGAASRVLAAGEIAHELIALTHGQNDSEGGHS